MWIGRGGLRLFNPNQGTIGAWSFRLVQRLWRSKSRTGVLRSLVLDGVRCCAGAGEGIFKRRGGLDVGDQRSKDWLFWLDVRADRRQTRRLILRMKRWTLLVLVLFPCTKVFFTAK
jgi:hypothetical protein